ncbi:MAG: hypothetical protein M1835_001555 [Candelina submexicana]|nr:MAG: hypothetical protein M1835_001555 [Candelina submexicana]
MSASKDLAPIYTSPKRKRDELEPFQSPRRRSPQPATVTIDVPSHDQQLNSRSEEGSPRAAVSSQFEDLNLEGNVVGHISFGEGGKTAIASKRLKPNHEEPGALMDPICITRSGNDGCAAVMEIPETPHILRTKAPCLNEIGERLYLPASHLANEVLQVVEGPDIAKTQEKSPSPSSPRKSSPEPETLTWREDEITGHNPDDPDDDGYGLNCIGFKPTPAIAYARTQHRKQQILEWKTREAREARQKRSDRRRGAVESNKAGMLSEIEASRRKVRFDNKEA